MKQAEYQKRFSINTSITFKPNSRQRKLLSEAAKNKSMSVNDYATKALTQSLKEEENIQLTDC